MDRQTSNLEIISLFNVKFRSLFQKKLAVSPRMIQPANLMSCLTNSITTHKASTLLPELYSQEFLQLLDPPSRVF